MSAKVELEKLRRASWSSTETANVELVADFVQLLMNDHNFDLLRERYGNDRYKQHNRNLADGLDGLLESMRDLVKRFPEWSYDVKRILADDNYVTFHSHATVKASHRGNDTKGFNIMDTWRIEDGVVVEHWDSLQALDFSMRLFSLMSGGKIANQNGVF